MGPFPLLLWVVVQTAWARIIPVKAALVLLACLVSTVACGDQIAATITGGNSGPLMSNDAGSADTGGLVGCPDGSLEFRALLFIKPQANVAGVAYAIDPADIDAATTGFGTTFVDWMTTLTNGRLCFVPEVSVSSTVLTTFSNTCDGGPGPWITDVADELKQLAPIGKYDSIFLYAPHGGNVTTCALWPTADTDYASFAYLDPRGAASWQDPDQNAYERLIWSFAIAAVNFYQNLSNVTPPPVPSPDDSATYGYTSGMAPYSGLKTWYADLLNRKVMQNGVPSGLGEPAWAHGNFRDSALLQ